MYSDNQFWSFILNVFSCLHSCLFFTRATQKRQSKIDSVLFYSGVYSSTHQLENIEFTTKSEAE